MVVIIAPANCSANGTVAHDGSGDSIWPTRADAVMIIDISGFTALGERLRAELGPEEGKKEEGRRGGVC